MPYLDEDFATNWESIMDTLLMYKTMRMKGSYNKRLKFNFGEDTTAIANHTFGDSLAEIFKHDRVDFFWPEHMNDYYNKHNGYPWNQNGEGVIVSVKFFFYEELDKAAREQGRWDDYIKRRNAIRDSFQDNRYSHLFAFYGEPSHDETSLEGVIKDPHLLVVMYADYVLYHEALACFADTYHSMREFYKELMGEYPIDYEALANDPDNKLKDTLLNHYIRE